MIFFLYLFVFTLITASVTALSLAGVSAIKEATRTIKKPRSPRLLDNIFDIGMTYVIGIVQIASGMVFLYIGYELALEMIREIGII